MDIILEGLLFVVGSEGLSLDEIKDILNVDANKAKETIEQLKDYYEKNNRAVQIETLGERYKLTTKRIHHEYYEKLALIEQNKELSQSSLETLAIIAYNEPITRNQIDEIRGVDSAYIVRRLIAREFIEDCGKLDVPGKPTIFKTTNKFLDYFGLKSKEELPQIQKEVMCKEVINIFESKYKEGE